MILSDPSWDAPSPVSPFFIRINELPQINDKVIK